jgi:hypothetical protein
MKPSSSWQCDLFLLFQEDFKESGDISFIAIDYYTRNCLTTGRLNMLWGGHYQILNYCIDPVKFRASN